MVEASVEVGKEYNVEIEGIAREGDGIARVEGFIIFILGTHNVGDKLKIKVDKVMPEFAIAHQVLCEYSEEKRIEEYPEEKQREVQASDILDKIKKGEPVEYDHVVVKGSLDLSKLDLPTRRVERDELAPICNAKEDVKIIRSLIKITDSKIEGILDFSNAIFQGMIFEKTEFHGDANFKGAILEKFSNFHKVTFNGRADFMWTRFEGDVYFTSAIFNYHADFTFGTFAMSCAFSSATFNETASFFNAIFNKRDDWVTADFFGATFKKKAFFNYVQFKNADFRYANFLDRCEPCGIHFKGYGNLLKAAREGTTEIEALIGLTYNAYESSHRDMQEIKKSLEDIKELLRNRP